MKKIMFYLICALLLCTTGCSKFEDTFDVGNPVPMELPLYDNTVAEILIPSTISLVSTDNHVFWEFSDNVSMSLMSNTNSSMYLPTEYPSLYLSGKDLVYIFDSCSLLVECDDLIMPALKELLGNHTKISKASELDTKYRLESLPTYNNVEMYLDARGFYMPPDAVLNENMIYLSSILTSGEDWIEAWLKDCTQEDIIALFESLAFLNTLTDDMKWYMDDEKIYVECGNNVCGAKRLSYNHWYIYYSSVRYRDFVLQGLGVIRRLD